MLDFDDDGETIFDKDGDFFEFLERHNYQFN